MITKSDASEKRPSLGLRGRLVVVAMFFAANTTLFAAEAIPPKPDRYFNDYAQVVSIEAAQRLNTQLAQFERETSNQIVVAVFPKMQSDSSIEDYAQRIAQSWAIGQKDKRNGVALLVFLAEHKISIQVGYGLEGALPDATAFDIRENEITPRFRDKDFEGGLAIGIESIEKAIRGEYQGSGRTVAERNQGGSRGGGHPVIVFIVFVIIMIIMGRVQRRRGYRYSGFGGPFIGGWSGGSGGGWSSGGGDSGGFSGGGGSFGGGGSSGSW